MKKYYVNIIVQPKKKGKGYEYSISAYVDEKDHSIHNGVFDSVGPLELEPAKAMAKALNNMPK